MQHVQADTLASYITVRQGVRRCDGIGVLQVTERLEQEQDGVDDEVIISTEDSCDLFDQLLDMIIGATQKVLDRVGGSCDYMLIVGGFGESTYLVDQLRQAFAGNVTHRIVSPDVPSQAVLKGESLQCG